MRELYIDSIFYLDKELKKYGSLIMYGDTKIKDRDIVIGKFQQDSNECRVFISNTKVGGFGISLDDRFGYRRRYMFIIPTYNFIDLHQATGRIHRGTTESKATIRFIYSREAKSEASVLNAIARKTEITKNVIYQTNGILFPGDYDSYVEGEGVFPNTVDVRDSFSSHTDGIKKEKLEYGKASPSLYSGSLEDAKHPKGLEPQKYGLNRDNEIIDAIKMMEKFLEDDN